jgi:GNAT superfamily N-acetyltransferase
MSAAVRVISADEGAAAQTFVDLPYRLYRDDPLWVPPLRRDERRRWVIRHNPSLAHRTVRRLVALQNGVAVGRIASIDDRTFARRWEPGAACFGFFESIHDPAVAQALFAAAESIARPWGANRLIGPINLTTHDETGILIEGFDSPPMVQSPYNPPWYADLLEEAGYRPHRDYRSFLWTPSAEPSEPVQRLVRAAATGRGIPGDVRIRPLEPAQWDRELRIFFDLYNDSFRDVWGFVPISWYEFRDRAGAYRSFLIPELALVAEVAGEPAGFSLTLPDVNTALPVANGRLWPFGWLRVSRAIRAIDQGRFVLLGVRPGRTGRGIGALLAYQTYQTLRRLGWKKLELSLVQVTNAQVRRVIEAFACPSAKTYRLYSRAIDGRRPAHG